MGSVCLQPVPSSCCARLRSDNSLDSQRGQIAIGWLIVEDLVMVLTLVLLPAVAGMVEKGDVGIASLTVDMGITIGKVVAFIAIMDAGRTPPGAVDYGPQRRHRLARIIYPFPYWRWR
ncbi:transport protein [Salmonella enterica subsp. enterica]|nr:transport protein [Salmonella enterica subsp. enterica]